MIRPPHWIEAGRGDSTLLCLHGVSGGAEGWRPLLAAMAGDRHRVLAWDMPGYGHSPSCGEPGFQAWTGAIGALLDAAGVDRVTLVGHSLGGMIALDAAVRMPGRITALVLACSTPAFGGGTGPAQRTFLARRLGPLDHGAEMGDVAPGLIAEMAGPNAASTLIDAHRALMAAISPDAYRGAIRALVGFDRRSALDGIACPALCVAGAQDPIATPALMRAMARRIPGARYAEIPGAGHLAPFEAPASFTKELHAFLGET